MSMILTTLAVVLVTAISIVWHLRRSTPPAASPARDRTCPRCGAQVTAAAEQCPACGVPLGAYELVVAPRVRAAAEAERGGKLHAVVRADVCVGCGACVSVCPVPGAIRLDGKLAVVDPGLCEGHGECSRACPVNGIVVTAGAAVQRLEVPEVDVNFESNVPGLYVVGELGGRGLIKNAINEGRIAAEGIARKRRATPGAAAPGVLDVVIVGSGPAGLSAGLEALKARLRYVVLEQGDLSDTIHRYPRHKLLLAEPVKMPLYGDLWVSDASKESLLEVWKAIITRTGLDVRTRHRVERIERRDDGFEVATGDGAFHARNVVLAMGRRGTPRRLGVPGEDRPGVFYDIVEMEAFAGRRVLVVGGGDSAIESAVGLATQRGTRVALSYRGDTFARLKDRNRAKLEAEVKRGRIELLLRSEVREIRPECVVLEIGGQPRLQPGCDVIIRIGGDPPYEFLKRIGVNILHKEVALKEAREAAVAR